MQGQSRIIPGTGESPLGQPECDPNSRNLPARLALVGIGTAGRRHLAAIRSCKNAILCGIVDNDRDVLSRFAASGVRCYGQMEAMIAAERPDGVVVATPTELHVEPAIVALQAGISVLIEKPIAESTPDAEAIERAAERSTGKVLVGHQRRYYPQVIKARQLIRESALGKLVMISGQWGVRKHIDYYMPEWRRRRPAGPTMINLVHDLDLLRFLVGEIESLSSFVSNSVLGCDKEDAAVVSIRFRSGALGSFVMSDRVISPWGWELATDENEICPRSGCNCFQFFGTKASLEFPNLVLWQQDGEDGDWTKPIGKIEHEFERVDPYRIQIGHFVDVCRGVVQPMVTIEDAIQSMKVALTVLEAADSGRRSVP